MTGRALIRAAAAAVVAATAAASAAATTAAAPGAVAKGCRVDGPTERTATRSYVLHVLGAERIFTAAEAARLKPTSGEVIVRGSLPAPARAGTMTQTHVSVHGFDRASGAAVWRPYPMSVTLGPVGGRPRPLAVALLQGAGQGVCDRHYGTNVRLKAGSRYRLRATLGGETVSFVFTAGAGHDGHSG